MTKGLLVAKEQELKSSKKQKLHPDILNILYDNRCHVKKKFSEVIGFYEINHISITIINPENEMVAFSTTPSIEYNLITQELWQHDFTLLSESHKDNQLIWWDTDDLNPHFNKIYNIKEQKNHFTLGMALARKIDGFCIVYSFATKNINADLRSYYVSNINRLYDIGDHCYKSIREIYSSYSQHYVAPKVTDFTIFDSALKRKPYLRLIVNNSFF
jgi:hypothetical protein